MFTIFPVWAAASKISVWRQRKAGICRISTYFAARIASSALWISVTTGILYLFFISDSNSNPSISPIPVKESKRDRLALRYDALKM